MGRLAGFKYRQIVRTLKKLGFEFDRQAAGSHEIWYNPNTDRYTTIIMGAAKMFFRKHFFNNPCIYRVYGYFLAGTAVEILPVTYVVSGSASTSPAEIEAATVRHLQAVCANISWKLCVSRPPSIEVPP